MSSDDHSETKYEVVDIASLIDAGQSSGEPAVFGAEDLDGYLRRFSDTWGRQHEADATKPASIPVAPRGGTVTLECTIEQARELARRLNYWADQAEAKAKLGNKGGQ
ncbi:MAG TPA: hypothetical protein VFQ61_36320 [Polyangiaceae bacterium]|nr:hypothetical protein [Polyangiaceae bacterium]